MRSSASSTRIGRCVRRYASTTGRRSRGATTARSSTRTTTTGRWPMRIARTAVSSAAVLLLATSALAGDVAKLDGEALAAAEVRAREAMASIATGPPSVEASQAFAVQRGGKRVEVLPVRYTPREHGELRNVDR